MNKLNEFLDTLKIHNKDISCFNDHLAVFKLKRLIKAERTSAEKEDNWISVEDELPKDSGYLLVCENEFGTQSILYGYYDGKKFQTVCGLGGFSDIRPTHWQPLPKPPKE